MAGYLNMYVVLIREVNLGIAFVIADTRTFNTKRRAKFLHNSSC